MEEDKIIKMIELLGKWGFPLTKNDLARLLSLTLKRTG